MNRCKAGTGELKLIVAVAVALSLAGCRGIFFPVLINPFRAASGATIVGWDVTSKPLETRCGDHCWKGTWHDYLMPDYDKRASDGRRAMKLREWSFRIEGVPPDYKSITLTDDFLVLRTARVVNFSYRYKLFDADNALLWDSGQLDAGVACTGWKREGNAREAQIPFGSVAHIELRAVYPTSVATREC